MSSPDSGWLENPELEPVWTLMPAYMLKWSAYKMTIVIVYRYKSLQKQKHV